MGKAAADTLVTLRSFKVNESTYDVFAERGAKAGNSVEREINKTLDRYAKFNDIAPLHFTDADRNELSVLTGRSFATPAELIAWLKHLISASVENVEIPLHTQLITRLQTRRFGATWEELLNRVVIESLETYVGLR